MLKFDQDTIEIITAISEILDIAETDILYHGWRVAYIAKNLALDLAPEKENELFLTGLVHDFGTFDLPIHIIHFENLYDKVPDKRALNHTVVGAQIISSIPEMIPLAATILSHHERIDGQGYPQRLAGDEISKESQIIRIADTIATRAHLNKNLDADLIFTHMCQESGNEFRPEYLDAVKNFLSSEKHRSTVQKIDLLSKNIEASVRKNIDSSFKPRRCCVARSLNFFGTMLDAKHHYTKGHSSRVADYAALLAIAVGMNKDDIEKVRRGGLLHDIGKIGVPAKILDKPGPLTDDEFDIIKRHPDIGARIVEKITLLKDLVPILNADQENFDGSGYPRGLKGDQIPLISRIVFIADAFDAMTSDRVYRRAMSVEKALAELKASAGTYFDPNIVKVACCLFKNFDLQ